MLAAWLGLGLGSGSGSGLGLGLVRDAGRLLRQRLARRGLLVWVRARVGLRVRARVRIGLTVRERERVRVRVRVRMRVRVRVRVSASRYLPRQADAQLRATRLEDAPQLEAQHAAELAAQQRGERLGEVRVLQRCTLGVGVRLGLGLANPYPNPSPNSNPHPNHDPNPNPNPNGMPNLQRYTDAAAIGVPG